MRLLLPLKNSSSSNFEFAFIDIFGIDSSDKRDFFQVHSRIRPRRADTPVGEKKEDQQSVRELYSFRVRFQSEKGALDNGVNTTTDSRRVVEGGSGSSVDGRVSKKR
jgi:hypothetical protein